MTVTATGFQAPTRAELVLLLREAYQRSVREIEGNPALELDYSSDTFLGNLTLVFGTLLGDRAEAGQAAYDARNPNNAEGVNLDDICAITKVYRKAATRSSAFVLFTGTPGTRVPEGFLVEGGGTSGRARWSLVDETTIPSEGFFVGLVSCTETGRVVAFAGDIDAIVNPLEGLESVSNPSGASAGRPEETDAQLRRRRLVSTVGGSGIGSVLSAVLALPFVDSAAAVENDTSLDQTVQGVTLEPHSFAVVVTPSTLTPSQVRTLAATIYRTAPCGIQSIGSFSALVTGRDGFTKTVRYSFATVLSVAAVVGIRAFPGFDKAAVASEAKAVVAARFTDLWVGDSVNHLDALGDLSRVAGLQKATLTFNGVADDVEPTAVQVAALAGPVSAVFI